MLIYISTLTYGILCCCFLHLLKLSIILIAIKTVWSFFIFKKQIFCKFTLNQFCIVHMRPKLLLYIIALILFLLPICVAPSPVYGQKSKTVSVKKQNKKNRDVKGTAEDKQAQMKQVEDELTKKHMRIQDKATRKRMKKTKKKSKRLKSNKKEPFFKKWFRKS